MKRIMIAAALVAGCSTTADTIYLDVEMASGRLDQPRAESAWVTGTIAYGENLETLPPGVFSIRVKHHVVVELEPTGPQLPVEVADATVHPISVCQAKTKLTCNAGTCYGEAVQPTLGICLLELTAIVDGQHAEACWHLGTYPRWAEATPEEREIITTLGCGGSSSLISASPP